MFGEIWFALCCLFFGGPHVELKAPLIARFPAITHLAPGKIDVERVISDQTSPTNMRLQRNSYRDCKLWPAGSAEWNIPESNAPVTIHSTDLQEFLENVDVVILSLGIGAQQISRETQETVDLIRSRGKECLVGNTTDMVARYEELRKQYDQTRHGYIRVGGLFISSR